MCPTNEIMDGMSRRHDLDFVRVAAFMLLIIYHVSLMYNSRNFILKAPDSSSVFDLIHLWTHPWRMSLLFLISGAVTGILLTRHPPGALRSARTRQLLTPLLVGLLFLIPPQIYVWLNAAGGVDISLLDVFCHYVTLTPVRLPDGELTLLLGGMQHLWYLAYLWIYTAILTFTASVWPELLPSMSRRLAALLRGKWILIVPTVLFVLIRLVLRPAFPPTLNILDDWYSHAVYFASFLFGVVMATRDEYWDAVVSMRKPALILALACAMVLALLFPALPAGEPEMWRALSGRAFGGTFQWCTIVAILGYAKICWNSENAVVSYLNRAVLTYYVLHQTVMLLLAYGLHQMGLMSTSSFVPIAVATLAVCALCYELKRHVEVFWRAWGGTRCI
ncbi:acyltransferase family protein [Rhizobium sp. NXC24]|uniref:acyltransferase family protein n=1 Tax=Rhizobium sp. NXC24 TaxID=2048897 RepID=UPI000CDF4E58|nr:acyltransferase 3 family protein [Rhizobium sp. NXC24]